MTSVSVIIPTWNREQTIKRAVLSALNQTHYVTEILVCDDGSTDNSKNIVAGINDPRVKWIDCGRNGMPAIPRNKGIQASTGEWLAFLDSDDEWLPNKVFAQIELAEKLGTKAACSNAFRITGNDSAPAPYLNYPSDKISFNTLLNSNFVICSSSIIKRSLLATVAGFPEAAELKALEDYALWLRVATLTNFAYINEPLVNYTDTPLQSIRSNDSTIWDQRKKVFADLCTWMESSKTEHSEYYTLAKKEYKKAARMTNTGLFSFILKRI